MQPFEQMLDVECADIAASAILFYENFTWFRDFELLLFDSKYRRYFRKLTNDGYNRATGGDFDNSSRPIDDRVAFRFISGEKINEYVEDVVLWDEDETWSLAIQFYNNQLTELRDNKFEFIEKMKINANMKAALGALTDRDYFRLVVNEPEPIIPNLSTINSFEAVCLLVARTIHIIHTEAATSSQISHVNLIKIKKRAENLITELDKSDLHDRGDYFRRQLGNLAELGFYDKKEASLYEKKSITAHGFQRHFVEKLTDQYQIWLPGAKSLNDRNIGDCLTLLIAIFFPKFEISSFYRIERERRARK